LIAAFFVHPHIPPEGASDAGSAHIQVRLREW
jgi:hypothetical protein